MAQKKVKFAIVGYGHIGKRHAAMVTGNELELDLNRAKIGQKT